MQIERQLVHCVIRHYLQKKKGAERCRENSGSPISQSRSHDYQFVQTISVFPEFPDFRDFAISDLAITTRDASTNELQAAIVPINNSLFASRAVGKSHVRTRLTHRSVIPDDGSDDSIVAKSNSL
jgi:hypothetical protein